MYVVGQVGNARGDTRSARSARYVRMFRNLFLLLLQILTTTLP